MCRSSWCSVRFSNEASKRPEGRGALLYSGFARTVCRVLAVGAALVVARDDADAESAAGAAEEQAAAPRAETPFGAAPHRVVAPAGALVVLA